MVLAHPGRTDSYGCHTCRTNCAKWGLSQNEYHCHASKGLEQPKEPVRSSATGITIPAPEYKKTVIKTIKTTPANVVTPIKVSTATSTKITPKISAPLQKSWLQIFLSKVF